MKTLTTAKMEYDKVENAIIKSLKEIEIEVINSRNSVWTNSVKKCLRDLIWRDNILGTENKYDVLDSGTDGELLYDSTWLEYEDENQSNYKIIDVHLVAECEWLTHSENISFDFNKLLIAKARHRLMIFQKNTDDSIREETNRLIELVEICKQVQIGDRFLIVGMNYNSWQFLDTLYIKQ